MMYNIEWNNKNEQVFLPFVQNNINFAAMEALLLEKEDKQVEVFQEPLYLSQSVSAPECPVEKNKPYCATILLGLKHWKLDISTVPMNMEMTELRDLKRVL